jgi:hypothetical protein
MCTDLFKYYYNGTKTLTKYFGEGGKKKTVVDSFLKGILKIY